MSSTSFATKSTGLKSNVLHVTVKKAIHKSGRPSNDSRTLFYGYTAFNFSPSGLPPLCDFIDSWLKNSTLSCSVASGLQMAALNENRSNERWFCPLHIQMHAIEDEAVRRSWWTETHYLNRCFIQWMWGGFKIGDFVPAEPASRC